MHKKIASELAIGIILLLTLQIGWFVLKSKTENNPLVFEEPPIKFNVASLCAGNNNPVVKKCGDYYRVSDELFFADAAHSIYRSDNGSLIGVCGGMPGPNRGNNAKECSIACENKNLCEQNKQYCPADAKLCSDGKTYVGRDADNNCEFKACP